MVKIKQFIACASIVLLQGVSFAEMRVWEETDGKRFEAEYQREALGRVYFRGSNGRNLSVLKANLVARDVKYINSTVPPEIRLGFSAKKKAKERNEDVDAGDQTTVVTATAKISKTSRTPFTGILRGELYLIGDEVATAEHILLEKKSFPIQFPEEKKPSVEFTATTEARVYQEYNSTQTRGRDYAGYVLVILGPSGDVIKTRTNLSWLKEEKIDALRKRPVRGFFDDDCRKRSTPRPIPYDRGMY